jgi:hypothetical protein
LKRACTEYNPSPWSLQGARIADARRNDL